MARKYRERGEYVNVFAVVSASETKRCCVGDFLRKAPIASHLPAPLAAADPAR